MFGLMVAVMVLVAFSARNSDIKDVALIVAASWACTRISEAVLGIPAASLVYPLVDFVCCVMILMQWERRPAVWKVVTALTYLMQVLCHFVFWLNGAAPVASDHPQEFLWRYTLALNVLFILQLGSVLGPGIADGLGGVDHLRRLLGWPGPHRPAVVRSKVAP